MVKVKTKLQRSKLLVYQQETATDYEIRNEEVNGTSYLVVPVVMMVEGVHSGSRGPILYTEEELAASVNEWNGVPVTIGHPQNDAGVYVSAALPDVMDRIVGRIYNPKMQGNKLTAECWIDVSTLTNASTEALEYIKEKKDLQVSIGVFSNEVQGKGEWEGEEYRAEAINLQPDHLALLPGEEGACNWEDGCGIRNKSNTMNKDKTKTLVLDKKKYFADFLKLDRVIALIANEASYRDIMQGLQDQLNRLDTPLMVFYLEEIFEDYFVYCVVNRESGDRKLYKRDYSVQSNNVIALGENLTEVRKEVSFVAMEKHKRTNFKTMKRKVVNNKCTCTVDSLIENKATNFTEEDREWLTDLAQEQLEKLAPKEAEEEETPEPVIANKKTAKVAVVNTTEAKDGVAVTQNEDGSIAINGKSLGDHIKESLAGETDPMKFIDNFMPPVLAEQMKNGLKMYQSRRNKLVKEIAANSKFKEAQLKSWSDEDINALHASLVEEEEDERRGNYSPLGGSGVEESEEGEGSAAEISAMMSFATPKAKVEKETVKK
jgi:hypothetical protein